MYKKLPTNGMLTLVKGGRCMRGSDEQLCFSEKERGMSGGIIWKGSWMKKMIGIIIWKEIQ